MRRNFLEVLLASKYSKTRHKWTSKKAQTFLEVLLLPFPKGSLALSPPEFPAGPHDLKHADLLTWGT